jgi:hypothetical protein
MMTKKRDAGPSIAPLQLRLFRLRELASKVIATKFEPDAEGAPVLASGERKFLSVALSRIGHGVDANEVLGVKAKRGERRKPKDGTPIEGRLSPLRLRQSNLRDMAINMALSRLKPRRKGYPAGSLDGRTHTASPPSPKVKAMWGGLWMVKIQSRSSAAGHFGRGSRAIRPASRRARGTGRRWRPSCCWIARRRR